MGGAFHLLQPRQGYRVAMDTILLAACVPAQPDDHVLEPGVGSGGAALALWARVKGACVTGIERDPEMLARASRNVSLNLAKRRIDIQAGDVRDLDGLGSQYHHCMMNPPYLDASHANSPPHTNKASAHARADTTLGDWIRYAVHHTKARGTITMIFRGDGFAEAVAGLQGGTGDLVLLPLIARDGAPAKRVILQAKKGSKGSAKLLAPLVMHGENQRYSAEAQAVLNEGAALDLQSDAGKALIRPA